MRSGKLMSYEQCVKDISRHSSQGMVVIDMDLSIVHGNEVFCSMAAMSEIEITGKKLTEFFADEKDVSILVTIRTYLKNKRFWEGELRFTPKKGPYRKTKIIVISLDYDNQSPEMYLVLFIPHQENVHDNYDDLTGLAGASIFFDRVEQALIASRRDKSKLAVLLVNLDRLSLLNDGLGYQFGDHVICSIAERLVQAFRETDTVARIVADNFALLTKITEDDHAALVAEKVLRTISAPLTVDEQEIVITASIGIATSYSGGASAAEIYGFAESALNSAKEMGGDHYQFFSRDLNEVAKKRIEMENSLRNALNYNEFLLFYQPKVDIDDEKIIGMEALIRWQHPEKGMVSPFHFIPVAEETGLIIEIGRWVLNEACNQNKMWQKKGLPALPIAVNVSARQFQHPEFVFDIKEAIEHSGLSPEYLELEITENMLMVDMEQTIDKLKELTGVGLSMAIDDFGTGYSNLSYLVRFPVSTLKIDRAFIKDLERDETIAALTSSIIKMSQNLNLKVVAEGAENREHIDFLRKHGCNVVQGFYYSKPLGAIEFEKLLRNGIAR